jgi:hypothetical protein
MLQQYQLLNECSGRGGRGILRFKSSLKDGVYSNLDFYNNNFGNNNRKLLWPPRPLMSA